MIYITLVFTTNVFLNQSQLLNSSLSLQISKILHVCLFLLRDIGHEMRIFQHSFMIGISQIPAKCQI